jgi:MtN3 and saliva related transmembrane protein
MDMATAVGGLAAFCTTVSYLPQLKKCWDTGHTGDLSIKMFLILTAGIALWVGYGILRSDIVIVTANSISLLLLTGIRYFKVRELSGAQAVRDDLASPKSEGMRNVI